MLRKIETVPVFFNLSHQYNSRFWMKSEEWDKINCLYQSLNSRLTDLPIQTPLSLSNTNYTIFVKQIRNMAGRLESKDDYVPKRGIRQTNTYFISRLGAAPSSTSASH